MPLARVTREQAKNFTIEQFDDNATTPDAKGAFWHYGKCEIQELLDYIYGVDSKGKTVTFPPEKGRT